MFTVKFTELKRLHTRRNQAAKQLKDFNVSNWKSPLGSKSEYLNNLKINFNLVLLAKNALTN